MELLYKGFIRILLLTASLVLFFSIVNLGRWSTILTGLVLIWCILMAAYYTKKRKEIITDTVILNALKK